MSEDHGSDVVENEARAAFVVRYPKWQRARVRRGLGCIPVQFGPRVSAPQESPPPATRGHLAQPSVVPCPIVYSQHDQCFKYEPSSMLKKPTQPALSSPRSPISLHYTYKVLSSNGSAMNPALTLLKTLGQSPMMTRSLKQLERLDLSSNTWRHMAELVDAGLVFRLARGTYAAIPIGKPESWRPTVEVKAVALQRIPATRNPTRSIIPMGSQVLFRGRDREMTTRLTPYSDRASHEFHELLERAVRIERKKLC